MTTTAKPTLPPFASLLKSRDVEDPVNLWVHRPLAYTFVKLIFPTPMTPNMVTFLAMGVGVASGVCFLVGTKVAMIWAGALLWSSAILDGADGILARAKNLQSDFGRAIDGVADTVVAVATVLPAFAHLFWSKGNDFSLLWFMIPALAFTIPHIVLYDFYKESFLRMTRVPEAGSVEDQAKADARIAEFDNADALSARLAELERSKDDEKNSAIGRFAVRYGLLPLLQAQQNYLRWTNPDALGEARNRKTTAESAAIYRRENRTAMRLWTTVSLCPHSYLMAICAMADRLDIYLWIRLIFMNIVFILALFIQRRSTKATLRAWHELDAAGAPAPTAA